MPKDATTWREIPELETYEHGRSKKVFQADILGSSPKSEIGENPNTAKLLCAALKAALPLEISLEAGDTQPACVNHSFVLQQSMNYTLYGGMLTRMRLN